MKSFKEFIKESKIDIGPKAQFRGLASEYERHIRLAAAQHDDEEAAKHHAKEAQGYLKRISDKHGSDKAIQLQKGIEIRMKHEAKKAFE
jgi:hypothetical protein